MKKLLCILIILCSNISISQSIEWSSMFNIHSTTATAGFPTNVTFTTSSDIIMPVVELDVLKFYKFNTNGVQLNILNTNFITGEIFSLLPRGNDTFSLLFNSQPMAERPVHKLITINNNLEVLSTITLNFPFLGNYQVQSFFSDNEYLYLNIFHTHQTTGDRTLFCYKINQLNELIFYLATSPGDSVLEEALILENGKFVLDYKTGSRHRIDYIDPVIGNVDWFRYLSDENEISLDYKKVLNNNEEILYAGKIRSWVDGNPNDIIRLKKIDFNGDTLLSTTIVPETNCIKSLEDFAYNPVNQHSYICYTTCTIVDEIIILELDENFLVVNQTRILRPSVQEPLPNSIANLNFTNNGQLILVYEKQKNSVEKGNLFIAVLDQNLEFINEVDLNFSQRNYNEEMSKVVVIDPTHLIITGYIPNDNPAISWEEVNYFIAKVNLDATLGNVTSDDKSSINISPNPVSNYLTISSQSPITKVIVFDLLGKEIKTFLNPINSSIDVSDICNGLYIVECNTLAYGKMKMKFIKK